ncbi:TPA: hypothetical protein ACXP4S_002275 [Klebsiella variicola subsp. variicola]|uniref:hypothetical protein n=1 Tax=Enterobacter sp. JUb54 TaxID=2724468 RepID=UPI00164D7BD7|nr:hypothetical protein [Enterobacter sp. JUb54]QNK06848.1 hypothetical protein HF679_19050 [Enterobacter sp. JUb54]
MANDILETACNTLWLDPKLVIPAITAVLASVIVPILIHHTKARRELRYKTLDIRTKVYTDYFKKYEEAAAGVGVDYEKFTKVTLRNAFRELLESNSSPEAMVKFSDEIGRFPSQIQDSHRKATEEITSLKILGSDELFMLTAEFEQLNQEIMKMTSEWLGELNQVLIAPDLDAPIAKKMKAKAEQIKELKDKIINQMRSELDLGKK